MGLVPFAASGALDTRDFAPGQGANRGAHPLSAAYPLRQGEYGAAEPILLECFETRTEFLGEAHPDTLLSLHELARLQQRLERWAEAEALAGMLLELTPEDADEYAERVELLDRALAKSSGAE